MAPAPPEPLLPSNSISGDPGASKPIASTEALHTSPHDQNPDHNASGSGVSGSMSSVRSKASLTKYSLFPPPSPSKEEIEASIPTLVAARAMSRARPAFPDMEHLRKRGASSKWHTLKQLVSKKSTIGTQIGATGFKHELGLQEFGRAEPMKLKSGSGSNSASHQTPMKSQNNVLEDDKVSDLIQLENPPKVIRRVRSEAVCSPKLPRSKLGFPNLGSLPRTPEGSSNRIQQASSIQTFPTREDSLRCTNVTNQDGSQLASAQAKNARTPPEIALCDLTSPDSSLHTPQDVSLVESDVFTRGEEDDSYSSLDAYYEEYVERGSGTEGDQCYSSDHPQTAARNKAQYTPFDPAEKLKTPNLTHSSVGGNGATELISLRNCQVRGHLAAPWSRTTQTGSPSPRSVESENVPRGILDNFIQSLAQNGHENAYGYGGGREASHAQTETLEALELAEDLAVVRHTISTTLEGDEVLNFDTTVSLADFLLHSLDTFTSNLWVETKKINDRRHLLEEKKQKLVQAIESAHDARALLQEEKEALQNEQVDVMKESLRLIQVYQE